MSEDGCLQRCVSVNTVCEGFCIQWLVLLSLMTVASEYRFVTCFHKTVPISRRTVVVGETVWLWLWSVSVCL